MEQQLWLINKPLRLGAIPFTKKEQRVAEKVWEVNSSYKKPDR